MPPRPPPRSADTIKILVATDSHVGYNERDQQRGDDSWKTFDEVMRLAKEHDVDMVLHGGDLFHENKPSRKSMYHVMQSLRMNCLGDKPCELEMLSDASEVFGGLFDHVNYEDPDINISIPVFAIHGNHDDPSGVGTFSALDLLQVSGLVNYYGRHPETDKVQVKPVLLQKGGTKLALYGLSNIRDERLFRVFKDGGARFFKPAIQKDEWFNLMTVHQNHHAYTETGYLPENFLPDWMDLVVWGHEHECLIEPRKNPEMGFHVIQPGSSIATSLMPGEAQAKHVCILSVTGRSFTSEKIRLRSVRPFLMKEIVLAEEDEIKEKGIWRLADNKTKVTQYLVKVVEAMIEEAKREWIGLQEEREEDEDIKVPLPLIRLRVEFTAPDTGHFDTENPQRFSNRFVGQVANTNDVVQFYRKKHTVNRTLKNNAELPDASILKEMTLSTGGVEKLVKEFLEAQSLTILPQNAFGDAVAQFIDKDDKNAVEAFLLDSLDNQVKHLLRINNDEVEEEDILHQMDAHRAEYEEKFAMGQVKKTKKRKIRPRPDTWDSELDGGPWEDQPGALLLTDEEDEEPNQTSARPRAAAIQAKSKTSATTRKPTVGTKKAQAAKGRGKKKIIEEEEEEEVDEDQDVIMIDDDDDDDEDDGLFVKSQRPGPVAKAPAARTSARAKPAPKKAPTRTTKQSTLNFSQPSAQRSQPSSRSAKGKKAVQQLDEDEISDDDDDAFEPVPTTRTTRRR